MAKKPNNTSVASIPANGRNEVFRDIITGKERVVSDDWKNKLATELAEWCLQDEALKITQFLSFKKVPVDCFYRWIKTNEQLKQAHEFAMRVIGDRREIGALKKKLDGTIVSYTMPHYDKDWKDLVEWRAKLKNEALLNQPTSITIAELLTQKEKDERRSTDQIESVHSS